MRDFLKNYNYKKHLTLCACVYGTLLAIDLTVGYVVAKKMINNLDEQGLLDE